jgi:hypothetical protein
MGDGGGGGTRTGGDTRIPPWYVDCRTAPGRRACLLQPHHCRHVLLAVSRYLLPRMRFRVSNNPRLHSK